MVFKVGSPVKGTDFIDRLNHIPELKRLLDNHQHTTIKAPRRFGKTSLIKHVLEHEGGYPYIYIDVRRAANIEQLANTVLNAGYGLAGITNFMHKAKTATYELLKSIQSIKLDSIGEVTLQMQQHAKDEMELLLHALDAVDKIGAKLGVNIVFVMDEFQDISELGDKHTLDKMRSVMQHHENITYVFLGSVESMMTYIFENKASPFFHFSVMMNLPGLDINELFEYCQSLFGWKHFKVDEQALMATLQFLEGHPDYSAQTLQKIYFGALASGNKVIDRDLCIESLAAAFMDNKAYLEELIAKAKLKKHHYEILYAEANGHAIDLSAATLYQSRASLENMGLLRNTGRGRYELVDIFLKLFLSIEQTDAGDVITFLNEKV